MTVKEIFPHPLSVHSYLLRIRGSAGIYMESGLLDLDEIAPLNEETYKPADLYYDNVLTAYWTTDNALMGTVKVSSTSITYDPRGPGESLAIGCKDDDKTSTITMVDFLFTGDTQIATSSSNVFCNNPAEIFDKRRAQSAFASSGFTGKMRMFVQAIYGSKRDYSMNYSFLGGSFNETQSSVQIGNTSLNPFFNSYILYTGEDYQYYVLRITSGQIRANKLELSASGEKLRNWLINHPQDDTEQRRYEGYLLVTAKFGDWVTVGSASDAYQKGNPLFWSWHANWRGSEAHMVVRQFKEGTTNIHEFTHFKLAISLTEGVSWEDSDNWTFTVTEQEATKEMTFRLGEDLMWSPDLTEGGMQVLITQSDAQDDPDPIYDNVPIYVMGNYSDDSFDVVRFERVDLGSGDDTFGGDTSSYDNSNVADTGPCGTQACDMKSESDTATDQGFYIEKLAGSRYTAFEAVGKTGDNVIISAGECFVNSETPLNNRGGNPGVTTCDIGFTSSGNMYSLDAGGGSIGLNGHFTYESILCVPWYDSDAAYIGGHDNFDGSITANRVDSEIVWGLIQHADETFHRIAIRWSSSGSTPPFSESSVRNEATTSGTLQTASGPAEWHAIKIERFANGEFETAHESYRVSSSTIAAILYIPTCFADAHFPGFSSPSWEQGDADYGGYGVHFNPVLFPIAQNAAAIVSRSNLTNNFRATGKAGAAETFIDEGEYNYDSLSEHLSYVGHD